MINKIKNYIKLIISNLVKYFIIFGDATIENKSLLIIRLDAIGDYILFRNFIEVLKNSEQYKDYKITLVGNIAYQTLVEFLDKSYIDKFIWVDNTKFRRSFFYRYNKLKEITLQGYEIVINSTYSRSVFLDDSVVEIVKATHKIGSIGDLSNISKSQKEKSDKYYTKLIKSSQSNIFEFDINKEFFENLLDKKLDIKKPVINLKPRGINIKLPSKYLILFIGASANFKKWDIKNYVDIAKYLEKNYKYNIVLCGGFNDMDGAKIFQKYFKGNYIDLVGKTSLVELLYVINKSDAMVANDTSAPHIAIALGNIKTIVIANGSHFGRFTHYPQYMTKNYDVVYPPKISKSKNSFEELCNTYKYGSKLDINGISVEDVKEKIDKVLDEKKDA